MKAIGLFEFGGPDVLQVVDIPVPVPERGEVVVQVSAVPVNPSDVTFRNGAHALEQRQQLFPLIPGYDFAGHITALGPGASGRLVLGEPVVGLASPVGGSGSYATFVRAREPSVVGAPAGASLVQASTLLLNALTARVGLHSLGLSPGERVLVTGAAGAVGGYGVQMAHRFGYQVIAVARPDDGALIREWGADWVIDRGPEALERIAEMFPSGIHGVLDAADLREGLLPLVYPGGRIATLTGWSPGRQSTSATVVPVVGPSQSENTNLLQTLVREASRRELDLRVSATLPFTAAADAHRLVEGAGIRGRVVLDFTHAT